MNIPDNLIENVIIDASSTFDSHDVIQEFARRNQRLYISELAELDGDNTLSTSSHSVREKDFNNL
jgi:hypothetical protein